MEKILNKLYIGGISVEELVQNFGSPLYVYDAEIIVRQYRKLTDNITYPKTKLHYACKANTNIEILKLLRDQGCNIEAVSPGEVEAAFKAGFTSDQIIFTCSNITPEELRFLIDRNITINLDSLRQIEKYGQMHEQNNIGSKISIRINQDIGAGHHSHVITGGAKSKFGIHHTQLDEAKQVAAKFKLKIIGIHQHIGSDILDAGIFMDAMRLLLTSAEQFKDLEFIDFGGGFGVPYLPNEEELDMPKLGTLITKLFSDFCNQYGKQLVMRFETGRYIVAEAGLLLGTVTEIKRAPLRTFVGLNTGFNHLIRPAMYGSYHQIVNASNLNAPKEIVTIAGNICESGDIFTEERSIAKFEEGNIAAILNTGAYGYSMASNYNSRLKPVEVLVQNGKARIIREAE